MIYPVVVPFHPTPLNKLMRMHWSKRNQLLQREYAAIAICVANANIPKATTRRRIGQRLTLTSRDRKRDNDGAWKGVLDALVKCGQLVDDGPDWVVTTEVEYERGSTQAMTLFIEDIPAKELGA